MAEATTAAPGPSATSAPAPAAAPSTPSTPSTPSPATPAAPAASTPAAPSTPSAPAVAKDRLSPEDVKQGLLSAAKTSLKAEPAPGVKLPGVEPDGSVKPDPKAEAAKKAAEADEGADDDKTPLPEIDENSLAFDQRQIMRRWKRTLDRTRTQLAAAAPKAEQYEKIQSYMDQFHLTSDQVALGFDVMAKLNTNPQLAYAALKPIMDELETRLGVKLPAELQQRVEQGLVDPKTAAELARTRGLNQFTEEELERQREAQTRQQQAQVVGSIQRAVATWEQQKAEKDPDFARKLEMVEDTARSIMAKEGKATTPQAAIAVLDRALQLVEGRLNPFRANGPATAKQPASTGAPVTTAAPAAPTNLREAALQGLNGSYRFQN